MFNIVAHLPHFRREPIQNINNRLLCLKIILGALLLPCKPVIPPGWDCFGCLFEISVVSSSLSISILRSIGFLSHCISCFIPFLLHLISHPDTSPAALPASPPSDLTRKQLEMAKRLAHSVLTPGNNLPAPDPDLSPNEAPRGSQPSTPPEGQTSPLTARLVC